MTTHAAPHVTGAESEGQREQLDLLLNTECWSAALTDANDLSTAKLIETYPLGHSPDFVAAADAHAGFTEVSGYLQHLIRDLLVDVSPAAAMVILRDLPTEMFDLFSSNPNMAVQRRLRAEVLLVAHAGVSSPPRRQSAPVLADLVIKVWRAAGMAVAENRAMVNRMEMARGLNWQPTEYNALPNLELAQAMRLFLERSNDQERYGAPAANGAFGTAGLTPDSADDPRKLTFLIPLDARDRSVVSSGSRRFNVNYSVREHVFELWEFLSDLHDLPSARATVEETYSLLVALSVLSRLIRSQKWGPSLLSRGLTEIRIEDLLYQMSAAIKRMPAIPSSFTAEVGLEHLRAMQAQPADWLGGPLLPTPVGTLIDAPALAQRFESSVSKLVSPSFGQENRRADHFEIVVQDFIDTSPWAPPAELRQYARLPLRSKAGAAITDIDAVGYRNGVLLAVNAKSFLHSNAYRAREFREMRNVETDLLRGLEEWQEAMAKVMGSAKGGNYDLSRATSALVILVTPEPCYVSMPEGAATAAPGLLLISSFTELCLWLQDDGSTFTPMRAMQSAIDLGRTEPLTEAEWQSHQTL